MKALLFRMPVERLLALFVLIACACSAQTLLFKSGFENNTAVQPVPNTVANSSYTEQFSGTDLSTGFTWPPTAFSPNAFGIHLQPNVGDVFSNHFDNGIVTMTGHTGGSTKALHMSVFNYTDGSCCAQEVVEANSLRQPMKSQYFRIWMQLPTTLQSQFVAHPDQFMGMWEWKTSDNTRMGTQINGGKFTVVLDTGGLAASNGGGMLAVDPNTGLVTSHDLDQGIPLQYFQQQNNVVAPTYAPNWVLVEVYNKRDTVGNGRMAEAINGQLILDNYGSMYGYGNEEVLNNYQIEVYGKYFPQDKWVDDYEIWDSPPCGTFPCGTTGSGPDASPSLPPQVTSSPGTICTVGIPCSYQAAATNSPASYAIFNAPAGMTTFNSSTGLLSGTPTTPQRQISHLRATNSAGSGAKSIVFQINQSTGTPSISSLTASPTSISPGQSTSLSWATSGATTVAIQPTPTNIDGTVTGTSKVVSPSVTTTYVLAATNSAGTVQRTVTVNVSGSGSLPTISSFTANPSAIASGNSSTLAWNVSGATTVSINQGVGSVGLVGSTSVSPTSTLIYTLTATNSSGGSVTATATVNVTSTTTGTHYISNSAGSDTANDGLSPLRPWKTINKVNSHSFVPDNKILFQSGDTWTGTVLIPSANGTSGHPITYGAYGSGSDPVIDGGGSLAYAVQNSKDYITFNHLQFRNTRSALVNFTGANGTQFLNITGKNGGLRGFYGGFLTGNTIIDHLNYSDDSSHTTSSNIVEIWQDCSTTVSVTNSIFDRSLSPGTAAGLSVGVNGGCNGTYRFNKVIGGGQGIGVKPYHNSSGQNCPSGFNPTTTNNVIADNEIRGVRRYGSPGIDGELVEIEGCSTSVPQSNTTVARNILYPVSDSRAYWGSSNAIGTFFGNSADIFGNVIIGACQQGVPETTSPGCIRLQSNSVNMRVYNNTLVGSHPDGRTYGAIEFFPGGTGLVKNNIISNFNIGILMGASSSSATEDYNIFDSNVTTPYTGSGALTHGGHSQTSTDPKFAAIPPVSANDVKLQATSPAIGFGATLGSPYNVILGMGGTSSPYPLFTQTAPYADGAFGYGAGTGGGPPGSPTISSFTASPTTVASGSPSTLAWVTTDADTLSIDNGIGPVAGGSASIAVSPSTTTTYILTATNINGSATASVTVTVAVPVAPVIESFTANPESIPSDHLSALEWVVDGADSITINQGIGDVTPFSLWLVRPRTTTTYTMTATNEVGSTTATVTVDVFTPVGPASENIRYHQVRQYDRRGKGHEFQMFSGWPPPLPNYPSLYDADGNVFPAKPRGNTDMVQMAKGPYTPGNVFMADADGNAVDGLSPPGAGGANGCGTWYQERPIGLMDGTNPAFALSFTPSSPFAILTLNGVVQDPYLDYTLAGAAIGMMVAPKSTDRMVIYYFACTELNQPPPPPVPVLACATPSWAGPRLYWRIYKTATNGGGPPDAAVSAAEVEFHAAIGGPNVAIGGHAFADSAYYTQVASNAFDGNPSSLWGGSLWIGYHLVAPQDIHEFSWTARNDSSLYTTQEPTAGRVEYSDDGSAWSELGTFTTPGNHEPGEWTNGETKVISICAP